MDKLTIGLMLIATRKYKSFVPALLEGVKKYFLINHNVQVHLFTDELEHEYLGNERVTIIKELIPPYTFPNATLLRYHVFTSKTYDCDYLVYTDVDMAFVDFIDESILGNIVAVRHPGYDVCGGGSWETNPKSTSYTYPENRIAYYAGGVQLGKTEYYYRAMQQMKRDIDEDERNGIIPIWHDESAWNHYLSECKSFKELDSSFCMVEQMELRIRWRIDNKPVKIIALAKDHKSMRE